MDIRSTLVAQQYAANKTATAPQPGGEGGTAFGKVAESFAATLQQSEQTAMAAMTGGADPHALVQALAQTELAVETAVTVRDKVVEAYQEILRVHPDPDRCPGRRPYRRSVSGVDVDSGIDADICSETCGDRRGFLADDGVHVGNARVLFPRHSDPDYRGGLGYGKRNIYRSHPAIGADARNAHGGE